MGKLQAGVFMLRPCAETTRHMLQLLEHDPRLHFKQDHAEQDFLDWYFKVSRRVLHRPWPHIPCGCKPCTTGSGSAQLRSQVLWRPCFVLVCHEALW